MAEKLYNLLATVDDSAWEYDSALFDRTRCLTEYMGKDLKERFGDLGEKEIYEIKNYPCIFAYEDYCEKDGYIGYITDVTVRETGVRIKFEKVADLSIENLHKLQVQLDIMHWELNRTHWTIKKVDLFEELEAMGINLREFDCAKPLDITKQYFDVSFSFAGEKRGTVEQVVKELEQIFDKKTIFYDNYYLSQLARPSLDILLQNIYRNRSKLIVVFLCEKYQDKEWCGLELRAIRELIMEKEHVKIMYIRLDTGHIDGVFKTDGYIDGTKFSPQELAKFIHERLQLI